MLRLECTDLWRLGIGASYYPSGLAVGIPDPGLLHGLHPTEPILSQAMLSDISSLVSQDANANGFGAREKGAAFATSALRNQQPESSPRPSNDPIYQSTLPWQDRISGRGSRNDPVRMSRANKRKPSEGASHRRQCRPMASQMTELKKPQILADCIGWEFDFILAWTWQSGRAWIAEALP